MELFFPYEISRVSYFFRNLLFGLVCTLTSPVFRDPHNQELALRIIPIALLAIALPAYAIFFIIRPRCNDIGIHWACSFIALVPYINIVFGLVLLFWPPKVGNL